MQHLARKTQKAVTRANKLRDREKRFRDHLKNSVIKKQNLQLDRLNRADIRAARTARFEDWNLGPLAPKRNVGPEAAVYGAMETEQYRGAPVQPSQRLSTWQLRVNDRVVIVEPGHRDRGKIDKISEKDGERNAIKLRNLNLVDVATPEHIPEAMRSGGAVSALPAWLPITSVRLITTITDSESRSRDVVVENVERGTRPSSTSLFVPELQQKRLIAGTTVEIPWPSSKRAEKMEYEHDTDRVEVEQNSFVPTLLEEPFPSTILDELRGKYSRFRERHDHEFLDKLASIDKENYELVRQSRLLDGLRVNESLSLADHQRLQERRKLAEEIIGQNSSGAMRLPRPTDDEIREFVGRYLSQREQIDSSSHGHPASG